jgi:phosphomannomutase
MVNTRIARYPSSGEINFRIADPDAAMTRVATAFLPDATARDDMDGLSLDFPGWRFNLRRSNTEPLASAA